VSTVDAMSFNISREVSYRLYIMNLYEFIVTMSWRQKIKADSNLNFFRPRK